MVIQIKPSINAIEQIFEFGRALGPDISGAGMPNLIATPQAITEKVRSEITSAITQTKENWKLVEIHCPFDTVLSNWHCDVHPLFK